MLILCVMTICLANLGEAQHSYIGLIVEDVRIMAASLGGDPTLIADFDTANIPGADQAVGQAQ